MGQHEDAAWFERERRRLAGEHAGRWIVVSDAKVVAAFDDEESAVAHAVLTFGVNAASVFEAIAEDRVLYLGPAFSR